MLTKRIVPCLDVDKGRVVKGKRFQNIQDVADPVELAKRYNEAGADELVFYDITASNEERNIFIDIARRVAREVAIPFTVGGGIRTIDDIQSVLHAGADKVSINSAALTNPDILRKGAEKFGSQCIVLSLDAREMEDGTWRVFGKGAREGTTLDPVEWAIEGEKLGAGEIVVNSINADGGKTGYSLELTKKIADAVNIPIVASGGAGKMEDFARVLKETGADAALAASVFHYGEIAIPELKDYLHSQNISIRR